MKIIVDIPDRTVCAFLNYLVQDPNGLRMCVNSIQSEDLRDGAELKIVPGKLEGGEND